MLDEDSGAGIPNARMVILYNANGTLFPVADTVTNGSGNFSVPYTAYPGGFFIIQSYDQPGYVSRSANPGLGGAVLTSNIVSFPAPAGGVFDTATFLDSRRPVTRTFDKTYLAVYSAPATFADIFPLVEMKRLEGYRVKTITTQVIDATVAGRDLPEKVRNWLKTAIYRPNGQPVYAVLIGRHDKIPLREVGWLGDLDHRLPGPDYFPALVTDWYYADLDSNWDNDNDGWYGEFQYRTPARFRPAGRRGPARAMSSRGQPAARRSIRHQPRHIRRLDCRDRPGTPAAQHARRSAPGHSHRGARRKERLPGEAQGHAWPALLLVQRALLDWPPRPMWTGRARAFLVRGPARASARTARITPNTWRTWYARPSTPTPPRSPPSETAAPGGAPLSPTNRGAAPARR